MEMTPRLGLPLLIAGQVQKEIFHNEALALVDLLVAGSVEDAPLSAPPPSPSIGRLYRIALSGASGSFAGHEGALAGWTDGGWRFVVPVEGMRLTGRSSGVELAYRDGAWTSGSLRASEIQVGGEKVVGGRGSAMADAAGGAVVDSQARAAVAQILLALRQHGLIAT
jgi:hypothetical protein